jgi:hypothetical protein
MNQESQRKLLVQFLWQVSQAVFAWFISWQFKQLYIVMTLVASDIVSICATGP